MLRAAAKNFKNVLTLASPEHYGSTLEALNQVNGDPAQIPVSFRIRLASQAFKALQNYDRPIVQFFNECSIAAQTKNNMEDWKWAPS